MSLLLALDSVTDLCRCALYQGQICLAHQCDAIGKGHGEHLIGQMEKLFQQAKLDKNALTHIAVTTGPGSFTGMRIGVAVARSLGLALGIEAIGVSRFDCIHYAVRQKLLKNMSCAVILPAVQDKFSVQIFSGTGSALGAPYQATAGEIVNHLPRPIILAGDSRQDIAVTLKEYGLEQFLKSGDRFSDKNCGKNKELEHLVEPSETKNALEQFLKSEEQLSDKKLNENKKSEQFVEDRAKTKTALNYFEVLSLSPEDEFDALAALAIISPSPQQPPSPLYMRPPDAKPAITNHIVSQNRATAALSPNPPAAR